jgi:ATP-dependent RNA helicase RhlE
MIVSEKKHSAPSLNVSVQSTSSPANSGVSERFDQLGLGASLLRAVREEGYDHPTPIQARAIPRVLEGRDLVGCAQTAEKVPFDPLARSSCRLLASWRRRSAKPSASTARIRALAPESSSAA